MDDNDTLLNFVAQRHTTGLEDAATDALCFILSRSTSAREALSDLLGLAVGKAKSWETDEHAGSVNTCV